MLPSFSNVPDSKGEGGVAWLRGDGLIDISCHFQKINHPPPDFKGIRREDEVEGTGFEIRAKLSKVGSREAR